jgi:hypothetical protein
MRRVTWVLPLAVLTAAASVGAAPGPVNGNEPLPPGHPVSGATPPPVSGNEPLPPGHPVTGQAGQPGQAGPMGHATGAGADDEEALPPGHPATGAAGDPHAGGAPHGKADGQSNGAMPGVFEPPPDTTDESADLPPGTILATIVDANERPIPNASITIGIVNNSVAKGESRKHITRNADAAGVLRLDNLENESHIAYRVTVPKDGAVFAAPPFRLPEKHGMRVKLHVYQVTHDIEQALIVTQVIVYVEMKDDRVQVQEALSIWNFGPVTWVPENVMLALPGTYTAFSTQQGMSDTGVDNVEKKGVRLRGTFAPGRHDIEFRWQLPYDGDRDVMLDVGMPPHLAAARLMAPASRTMGFFGTGFPAAVAKTDNQGQRILITEKQLSRGEAAWKTVHIEIRDLPVQGPGRYIATALAAMSVVTGLALGLRGKGPRDKGQDKKDAKDLRTRLLQELEELEHARRIGDVGPETYTRARRELIDQIALTFAPVT